MRRMPTQERAQRTIETLFDATLQLVEQEGEAGLTTNRIAEKAGFSVGTLYQYFPTKEALLLALIHRERRLAMAEIETLLERAIQERAHPRDTLRAMVRVLIRSFGCGPRLRRAMVKLAWRMDHHENITQALRESAERNAMAMARADHPELRAPTPAMMFVATRAVMGAIRSASLEDSPLLGSPEFEDELVGMLWGMLRAGHAPAATSSPSAPFP
jgi:AcrR family transcriptional regulator